MVERLRVLVRGAVQGVGFRPFVYRLATELGLTGWVSNTPRGVAIETEGPRDLLESFLLRLDREKPPRAFFQSIEPSFLDARGFDGFDILESEQTGEPVGLVLPDVAPCPDCLQEIFDISNRRYLYPFTNCTNCGPRYTIMESMPYDRAATTMAAFAMCPACRHEYQTPSDRRFHAQPNACPICGPHLELWDPSGRVIGTHREAMIKAVRALQSGSIVAVKGVGGFHLMTDARRDASVTELRKRKARAEKPLAVMFPSLESIRGLCTVSDLEERLLLSPEAPIVLLRRSAASPTLAKGVAPNNPYIGAMLPSSPLHHILMRSLGFPIVATSGNRSEEPICTDEREALRRLAGIADLFLVHDRPIRRHVDDSIVVVMMGRETVLRRARGYAPLPVSIPGNSGAPALAVGAHLKNTVGLSGGDGNLVLSQHIGDLESRESLDAFQATIADLQRLLAIEPVQVATDLHPDYHSTIAARETGLPLLAVQHHHAHIVSCMADNQLEGTVLGVAWDGTGLGTDGTIWGGEFLLVRGEGFDRVATMRSFMLPGGDQAIREPRRSALGVLHEIYGDSVFSHPTFAPLRSFSPSALASLRVMMERGTAVPRTTSAGRLFDAVASLCNLRHLVTFEGQAAMELEYALVPNEESYPFLVEDENSPFTVDWIPMILGVIDDLVEGVPVGMISAKFHNALVESIVSVARRVGQEHVVLSGGCFQNRILTEQAVRALRDAGFRPYWHQRVPPNDGGISLGQLCVLRMSAMNTAVRQDERMVAG